MGSDIITIPLEICSTDLGSAQGHCRGYAWICWIGSAVVGQLSADQPCHAGSEAMPRNRVAMLLSLPGDPAVPGLQSWLEADTNYRTIAASA
ncbi:MAG: hypothetical protein ACK55I_18810 [bacterium]|jgi:hypothetical protein